MNFLEAVQALNNGECRFIQPQDKLFKVQKGDAKNDCLYWVSFDQKQPYKPSVNEILCDWQLVNPIPWTEPVEVVRWECKKCGGIWRHEPSKPDECKNIFCDGTDFIKLKGIDHKPLPRRVVKEWRGKMEFAEDGCLADLCPISDDRPDWIAGTTGEFIYRAEVEG